MKRATKDDDLYLFLSQLLLYAPILRILALHKIVKDRNYTGVQITETH